MQVDDFIQQVKENTGKSAVKDDHKPTANERNNIVHLCFKYALGLPFRQVDLHMIELMSGDVQNMEDLRETYVSNIAEYIWDHYLGEPANPSREDLRRVCSALVEYFFSLNEEIRNDVNDYAEDSEVVEEDFDSWEKGKESQEAEE